MKFSQFIARWIWHTTALKYLSYHFGWPHKWRSSQGHTWKKMTWPVLLIWSSQKFDFMTIFMFSRVRNPFLTLLLSYHVSVTSKIQVNFRYRRYLKVLMIVSYGFLKFLHYLCFRGWGIHFWYSYWATMFRWPRKFRSTSGTGGTWRYWWLCLMDFWNFFTIYVFEGEESISDIPIELPCFGDLEVQVNFRYRRYSKVLMIVSYEFLIFFQYLCFRGQEIHFWHSYWATMFGWPRKSRSTSGTGGTDDSVLWIFEISLLFMFSRSMNPLLIFLLSYLVWVTSKTSRIGSWPRFLRSPKRGSSVGISAMDSLTSKT